MGKTLTNILLVGAAIAANFVLPGIGLGLGTALTTAVTAAGIGAGLQLGAGLLGLGASLPKPNTTEMAIKTPRPERVSAYGRARTYAAWYAA